MTFPNTAIGPSKFFFLGLGYSGIFETLLEVLSNTAIDPVF